MSVVYFYSLELVFPHAHRPCSTPLSYCTCVSAGRQRIHMCLAGRIDAFSLCSNECVLILCSFHRLGCSYATSKSIEVLLVDIKSRYRLGNTTGGGKNTFFPATPLVSLVCDQMKGLTWFSAVFSTHTSQWSWWEVQELTVFEIKPRIWLIMLWRSYLTTKWKYIHTEGTKAFLLNILLWSNLLGGVSITKLQLLYSSYNSFIETIFSVF